MNNFFFDESDYSLFKKALRATEKEPVIINILSTDSSLQSKKDTAVESAAVRKNMSKKYEPSPFGKFFGPRKQQAVSVDMKDFSSWKNKNYRRAEESINTEFDESRHFSLTDFMSEKSRDKFNELDQAKSDLQKPIDQLSTSDPLYKRFSLDSYMHKLEEQTRTKDSFEENDDILEPLGDQTQNVLPDSSQDENFGFGSNVNIEKVAFDENISGDTFKFEQEELDKFKARIEKIEREAANIKEKTTEKVISTNELSELSGFNIDNLTEDDNSEENELVDDIEKINASLNDDSSEDSKESPKNPPKTFYEVNKNENIPASKRRTSVISGNATETLISGEISEETDENVDEEFDALDENISDENINDVEQNETEEISGEVDSENIDESSNDEELVSKVSTKTRIDRSDIVTKDDLKSMTDELVDKFTQLYGKDTDMMGQSAGQHDSLEGLSEGYITPDPMYGYQGQPYGTQGMQAGFQPAAGDLRSQLQELIDTNRKLDYENERRLREAEFEKERVAQEYESRIKEMEMSFKQNYEDFKKQAYLDKLDRDIKLKEAESKFKKKTVEIKEQEKDSYSKKKTGAMLRKELKSNFNISNLEMDKKLLEVASTLNRAENEKLVAENNEMERRLEEEVNARLAEVVEDEVEEEIEEVEEEKPAKTTTRRTTTKKRKSTTTRRSPARKGSRRKIDSDIIGGIDFE